MSFDKEEWRKKGGKKDKKKNNPGNENWDNCNKLIINVYSKGLMLHNINIGI